MKKDWAEEVGEKNGGCFDNVGGAGRLVSHSPGCKSKFGWIV